jgi:hypothetical protein
VAAERHRRLLDRAGPSLEDHWGPRAQAFPIVHHVNAHTQARKLSARFDGQIFVEAVAAERPA